jgi:hypothetical protein
VPPQASSPSNRDAPTLHLTTREVERECLGKLERVKAYAWAEEGQRQEQEMPHQNFAGRTSSPAFDKSALDNILRTSELTRLELYLHVEMRQVHVQIIRVLARAIQF